MGSLAHHGSAGFDICLIEQVAQVKLNCALTQDEQLGNLTIGFTFFD